jgi:hypothetical protein
MQGLLTKLDNYFYFPSDTLVTSFERRRLKKLQSQYTLREIGLDKVNQSIQSWVAHLEHGDTWRLREKVFTALVFTRE